MSKKFLRRVSQTLFLILFLFLFLQTQSKGNDTLGYPVKLFLDFDPLIFITTFLSTRAGNIPSAFYLSVILIILTVFLGRVFCGWICPLGTLNNLVGSLKKSSRKVLPPKAHRIKYYILLFVLVSSVFTLHIAGIFDPLSLLIRSFSLSVYPLMNYAVSATFDTFYDMDIPVITAASESIYAVFRERFLAFQQPYYLQSIFIGTIFFSILALNLLEKRFWCRYLCPLGALLGICSKYALLKRDVSEGCTSCGLCGKVCQSGAANDQNTSWEKTECIACFNCDDVCPVNTVHFGFGLNKVPLDLGRRGVAFSVASGLIAAPLFRSVPFLKPGYSNPKLIRPPGAQDEKEFLQRCVKCGECMKVCITNGLQPTLLEAGLEGIWTPRLIPRIGYCEYRCTLCGQVCPSGAIQELSLDDKVNVRIGTAMIDKGRCLPYAHSTPCIVCEEVCPTSQKAIWLEDATVQDREGNVINVKLPHIDLSLCIGCGICETQCPVGAQAAIYVTNIGETRSTTNQLLL